MRQLLMVTTAFVLAAGAAQAAEAPVQVTLGGYVDFRAALFHEATNNSTPNLNRRSGDMATEYLLSVAAEGQALRNTRYGAYVSLSNIDSISGVTGLAVEGGSGPSMEEAYVWVSGDYGKVILGDEHGPSDMFVSAPTVGEGQIDGSYTNFTNDRTLLQLNPMFISKKETATKATYLTPKFGNQNHMVQLGVAYAPQSARQGNSVGTVKGGVPYKDTVEGAARYEGKFGDVDNNTSLMIVSSEGDQERSGYLPARSFTLFGIGTEFGYRDFTFGGSFVDAGNYGTYKDFNQVKDQHVWSLGVKYEWDKMSFAVNGLQGKGYYNTAQIYTTPSSSRDYNYVNSFSAVGFGATYNWFPGLTSALDMVIFDQERAGNASGSTPMADNHGNVIMFSQKMVF